MKVHRENIIIAVTYGISKLKEVNEKNGFTGKSALIAGLEETLKAIINGGDLEFYEEMI